MTSGEFHSIPINSITVDRPNRQRREISDVHIASLADSLNRLGLIHPIVITRDTQLVAGECRLAAAKKLGWTHISTQYADELDENELRAIELEENIKRLDIDWRDEVRAVAEYHKLRKAEKPDWGLKDTAEAIGLAFGHVHGRIEVAKELSAGNIRVAEAPKLSIAYGIVARKRDREIASDEARLIAPKSATMPILTTDFNEWVKTYAGPKFNFIHCDFPYGIGADKFNQGAAPSHGAYVDDEETFWNLMSSLHRLTLDHTSESSHLIFWFSMRKGVTRLYEPVASALESFGYDVNPLPLIWVKSDNSGILPDPARGPRQIYETAFFASRGDRKIVQAVANAIALPSVRDRHMSEKSEAALRHFFRMFVDSNTVMLDPTCGSGSSLRAAESLGARSVLGLELNEEFAGIARTELERARASREKETAA